MLHVISSNRLEQLLEAMMVSMGSSDHAAAEHIDPLIPATVVVQNAGMSRWVSQQIALRQGISAHINFETPGAYLWRVARHWIAELPETPYRKDILTWQIFTLLPGLLSRGEFSELRGYLEGDQDGALRLQLAQSIGNTFDRYLIYRPQLINRWEVGADQHWQAILWRQLHGNMQGHWGTIESHLGNIAGHLPPAAKNISRGVVNVFGISDMPPLYTSVFSALASHTSVDLYYLNPCEQYWADIVDEQQQSRRRATARKAGLDDPTGLLDIGNPLLASWGHAGQAFLDQLLESGAHESEVFVPNEPVTLLQHVQNHILELADVPSELTAYTDQSMQVHNTHSPLREVQILHDQLLGLFEQHKNLKPRDIIVMAPDIDQYAPFVEATFALAQDNDYIPWSISDRRLRTEQQALEVLNWLLQLPVSRFESTEILALFDLPSVRSRFSVDNNSLQLMRQWVRESGIRWSLDAGMRASLDLPASDLNSWKFGLRRLFLGFALPDMQGELYRNVSPYPHIEGAQSEDLEVLAQVVSLCAEWRSRLQSQYTPQQWLLLIDEIISDFFAPDDTESQALQAARNKLFELLDTAGALDSDQLLLSREVVAEMYHQVLEDSSNERNFLTGRITFSNMVPMRSIPFKVVCILGMNAEDFPRGDNPQSFDLMAAAPKRGDRRRRNDDRYLFLEALLSARDVFYVSYVGRDVRDNSEKAASAVVVELMNYAGLTAVVHPLQPFSQQYFDNINPQLFSYKYYWFDAARAQPQLQIPEFIDASYQSLHTPETDVDLSALIRYVVDPSTAWLEQSLEVRHAWKENDLETTEPFALNNLDRWKLKQVTYELFSQGDSPDEIKRKLIAQGEVPYGKPGKDEIDEIYNQSVDLDSRVYKYINEPVESLEFDIPLQQYNLFGRVARVQKTGVFDARFGKLRVKDLLTLWINHLVVCENSRSNGEIDSVMVFEDWTVKFQRVENAHQHLFELLELRHLGLCLPQPWLPEPACAEYISNCDDADKPNWNGPGKYSAEDELKNAATATVWRGRNPYNDTFLTLTNRVMSPLFRHAAFVPAIEDVV